MYDLLSQPMESVKLMMNQQSVIDGNIEFNNRRTEEHEFIIHKFQKGTDLEAEYRERLGHLEKSVRVDVTLLQANVKDLESKLLIAEKRSIDVRMQADSM